MVVARIRAGFESAMVGSPAGALRVEGSVGCAVIEVEADGERFPDPRVFDEKSRDLIQRADEALYAAKRGKRERRVA